MKLNSLQKYQLRRVVREAIGRSVEAKDPASIAQEVINVLKSLGPKIEKIDNPDIDDAYRSLLEVLKDELEP